LILRGEPKPAKRPKPVKAQPYPYVIPSIEYLKEWDLKHLKPWDVQEFFRVEALLRSPKVAKLYKETYTPPKPKENRHLRTDSLFINYQVWPGWSVLKGKAHHYRFDVNRLSEYAKFQPYHASGIYDLKVIPGVDYLNQDWPAGKMRNVALFLGDQILSEDPKLIHLTIDATYPTQKILSTLRKIIGLQKEKIKNTPDASPWFQHRYLKSGRLQFTKPKHVLKLDAKTWIDYFLCYDLRHCGAKTFGQIARKVYGDAKKYEVAEHAYKRVCTLIQYAETKNWPPPPNFLNKK